MKNKKAFSVIATTLVCSFFLAFAPSGPVHASDDTAIITSGVRNDSADEIAKKLYKTLSANNTGSIKTTYKKKNGKYIFTVTQTSSLTMSHIVNSVKSNSGNMKSIFSGWRKSCITISKNYKKYIKQAGIKGDAIMIVKSSDGVILKVKNGKVKFDCTK